MIKIDTTHTTLLSDGLYSANQPIIISLTDDTNPDFLTVTLNGIEFIAYNINGRYDFNLTDYVRSQFKYQEPVVDATSNNFKVYSDTSVYIEIDMIDYLQMLTAKDSILVTKVGFVNCEVDREQGKLNPFAPSKFFTSREYLEYWGNYPYTSRFIYFKNQNIWLKNSISGWSVQNPMVSLKKVVAIDYANADATALSIGLIYKSMADGDPIYVLKDMSDSFSGGEKVEFTFKGICFKDGFGNTYDNVIPPILIYKNYDEFDPEDYTTDNFILLPKNTTSFTIPEGYSGVAVLGTTYEYVSQNWGAALVYNSNWSLYIPYYKYAITSSNYADSSEQGSYIEIRHLEEPHNSSEIKYINRYGGWDYYRFNHKQVYNYKIEESKSLNKVKESLADSRSISHNTKRNNTVSLKSDTETTLQFKSIAFAPFSPKVMHLIYINWENKYKWENVIIDDYEMSFRPCEKAGSVEITLTNNNQYTLSDV